MGSGMTDAEFAAVMRAKDMAEIVSDVARVREAELALRQARNSRALAIMGALAPVDDGGCGATLREIAALVGVSHQTVAAWAKLS
jgi:hypothetical protein